MAPSMLSIRSILILLAWVNLGLINSIFLYILSHCSCVTSIDINIFSKKILVMYGFHYAMISYTIRPTPLFYRQAALVSYSMLDYLETTNKKSRLWKSIHNKTLSTRCFTNGPQCRSAIANTIRESQLQCIALIEAGLDGLKEIIQSRPRDAQLYIDDSYWLMKDASMSIDSN